MILPFRQIDVFSEERFGGNPLAVVLEADEVSSDAMSRFARWTNLSETTFLLQPTHPQADYRVRIFTSASETEQRGGRGNELPFAGHPTLGTCHTWLETGGRPKSSDVILQECGAGLIPIRRSNGRLAFAAPPLLRSGDVEETLIAQVAAGLAISRSDVVDAQWIDNGPGWVGILLESAEAVLALRPEHVGVDVGVIGPYPPGSPEAFELRAFCPKDGGVLEDPVTGSLNASAAQWLLDTGRAAAPYLARQGTVLGRAGRIHVSRDDDGTVWIGGRTSTCIRGEVEV